MKLHRLKLIPFINILSSWACKPWRQQPKRRNIEDEEDQEAVEDYIEKEHQDYMLLKAEESDQKKKG